jgi:Na+-translocating ferredoxin:NAD+ oxidoreductase RnfG subunit
VATALLLLGTVAPGGLSAQRLTQDEALRLAFPDAARFDRQTAFLSEAERAAAEAAAAEGIRIDRTVVTYYVARDAADSILGVAYFDAHIVRTLDEVLMIVVGRDDTIRRIDVLRFREPPEYRAPDGWIDLLEGRALNAELSMKGDIPNITGASLTARAVTQAARRALALHGVIGPFGGGL